MKKKSRKIVTSIIALVFSAFVFSTTFVTNVEASSNQKSCANEARAIEKKINTNSKEVNKLTAQIATEKKFSKKVGLKTKLKFLQTMSKMYQTSLNKAFAGINCALDKPQQVPASGIKW